MPLARLGLGRTVNLFGRQVSLLDCTLRDGGYYNRWDFSLRLVYDYLKVMDDIGVDSVELGFRHVAQESSQGPFFNLSDEVIGLFGERVVKFGVMIDVKDLIGHNPEQFLALLFPGGSPLVEFVRLASLKSEVDLALSAAKVLNAMGKRIFLNVMQADDISAEEILDISERSNAGDVDVLYWADSFGSLLSENVAEIVSISAQGFSGPIGLHAHDNMGRALENSKAAIEAGATWVDATVCGMGRGAGNTKTEDLIRNSPTYVGGKTSQSLEELISHHFNPLMNSFGWGPNAAYARAASLGVHPSYVQEMISLGGYSLEEVDFALSSLAQNGVRGFRQDLLAEFASFSSTATSSSKAEETLSAIRGIIADKKVLIVGSGPSVLERLEELTVLTKSKDFAVFSVALARPIPEIAVDLFFSCHPLRIGAFLSEHPSLAGSLVAPPSVVEKSFFSGQVDPSDYLPLDISLCDESLGYGDGTVRMRRPISGVYALEALAAAGAEDFLMFGMDGYVQNMSSGFEESTIFGEVLSRDVSLVVKTMWPSANPFRLTSFSDVLREVKSG